MKGWSRSIADESELRESIKPQKLQCSSHSQHLLSSLILPGALGKCEFYWLSSPKSVSPRLAWAMWTRGQVGKASLPFRTYRTSALPTASMFRGASGRKES